MNVDTSNNLTCSINNEFKEKLIRQITGNERKTVIFVAKEDKRMSLDIYRPGSNSFSNSGALVIQHLFSEYTNRLGREMTLVDLIGKRIFSDINQLTQDPDFKFYPTPET
jgi:hypothetical protein